MPLNLDELAVFVRAAQTGNISEAARQLGLSPQIASRRLVCLEQSLGVRLLHRNTRHVSLTPDGEVFLPAAERLIHDAEIATTLVGTSAVALSGLLRVTAPVSFGLKVLMPIVAGLLRQSPTLRIDLQLSDSVVDLVESGIDLAIRISSPRDTQLIGKRLASSPLKLVAAPSYIAKHGSPSTLSDLSRHSCLTRSGTEVWTFIQSGKERAFRVHGSFCSNLNESLRQAAIDGLGIGLHSSWDVNALVTAGELLELQILGAAPRALEVWALWPHGRLAAMPRTRALVEQLAASIRASPFGDAAKINQS